MKRMAMRAMAMGAWLAAAACAASPHEPNDSPSVQGSVRQIQDDVSPPRILVAGEAWVALNGRTRLLERRDGALRQVEFGALQVGDSVRVWFTGPVAESYPLQATAGTVIVER
jgi:Protein of unknown function (DUF3221)